MNRHIKVIDMHPMQYNHPMCGTLYNPMHPQLHVGSVVRHREPIVIQDVFTEFFLGDV
jgi:hypothetical protein